MESMLPYLIFFLILNPSFITPPGLFTAMDISERRYYENNPVKR